MKIYTKTGDDGTTGLLGNQRVRKDDPHIEACGEIDELNAALGVILSHLPPSAEKCRGWLDGLQSDLFVVGTLLATPSQETRTFATLTPARAEALEVAIDQMEGELEALKNFILPQGTSASAYAHLARAIARRAERHVVTLSAQNPVSPVVLAFVNRVSDFLFVLARWINHREGGHETAWINLDASGSAASPAGPVPDRMSATLQKLEDDRRKRQTLFEKAASDLERKKRSAQEAFKQNFDQIKKDGGKVDKPFREIDLD